MRAERGGSNVGRPAVVLAFPGARTVPGASTTGTVPRDGVLVRLPPPAPRTARVGQASDADRRLLAAALQEEEADYLRGPEWKPAYLAGRLGLLPPGPTAEPAGELPPFPRAGMAEERRAWKALEREDNLRCWRVNKERTAEYERTVRAIAAKVSADVDRLIRAGWVAKCAERGWRRLTPAGRALIASTSAVPSSAEPPAEWDDAEILRDALDALARGQVASLGAVALLCDDATRRRLLMVARTARPKGGR